MQFENIVIGTEKKLALHIEPIGNITMNDYDFVVEYFCSDTRVERVTKAQMREVSSDNYIIRVDTAKVGCGRLKCRVIAYLPDSDFEDGTRTEIYDFSTSINIVSRLK